MTQYSILLNISIISLLIPIIAGAYRLKVLHWELKILVFYLFLGFVIAIINWYNDDKWTRIVINIYTIFEYIIIMLIIGSWQNSRKNKRLFSIILLTYIPFWFISKITFEPITALFSITSSISQAILTLSAGYTLFVVIANYAQSLLLYQRFWILIALIINFSGTLMPTALTDVFIVKDRGALILLYSINWVLIIISNILFTIGILCPPAQQS
jgi:hypothetical protein